MSRIEEMLKDKKGARIDYDEILKKCPWIVEKNRYCVLSPDSDGLLCGLFMAKQLDWKIVGFYDDKVCLINKDYTEKDIVFLDGEIFRKQIKSMGHHMVLYNKNSIPSTWNNFDSCIQPNIIRNYDGAHDFRLKYPLATIHMLTSIVAYKHREIKLPESAIPPLLFTDGVFMILFSYPENVLNWLHYLRIDEEWNPMKHIFENESYTVFELMKEMNAFFRQRDLLTVRGERGDRLKISDKAGNPCNIEAGTKDTKKISKDAKDRSCDFINILGEATGWRFFGKDWDCWDNLKLYKFSKGDFVGKSKRLNNSSFSEMMSNMPLSWAMTSGNNIEYTIEDPDFLEINRKIKDYLNLVNTKNDTE